uniref:Uncharacterized protein n=1 Tax=Physcomitrium patens TaxID=3218 RepID=A0A2K1JV23_PHYPA|nr:hypothetical protein PHYPA_015143 [Physcomitrium patens]
MRDSLESVRNNHPLHLIVRCRNSFEGLQALKGSSSSLGLVRNHTATWSELIRTRSEGKLTRSRLSTASPCQYCEHFDVTYYSYYKTYRFMRLARVVIHSIATQTSATNYQARREV